jgi:predicted enzyme related to lactoylglutathione lyase
MTPRLGFITVDCADPDSLATFWCAVLGHEKTYADEQWARIGEPGGAGPQLLFQRVPEAKVAKNRVHVDLLTEDLGAEVERLRGHGAVHVESHTERGWRWAVMADPEGNEFCVAQSDIQGVPGYVSPD